MWDLARFAHFYPSVDPNECTVCQFFGLIAMIPKLLALLRDQEEEYGDLINQAELAAAEQAIVMRSGLSE